MLRRWIHVTWMAIVLVSLALPASATTLMRAGLEKLTVTNRLVVVGEVVDVHSYWNDEASFILTDVEVKVLDVVKGNMAKSGGLTLTLMGGTVGDQTTLILGGAELIPGSSYLLFLNEADLPGASQALTVRDHCQGAFDLMVNKFDQLRAVSQANRHPLVPDEKGFLDAPGGVEGLSLDAMIQSIADINANQEQAPRR